MKKMTAILPLILLGIALVASPAFMQGERVRAIADSKQEKKSTKNADIEKLHVLVRKARADLKTLRKQLGLPDKPRREGRGEHGGHGHEGRGEHGERGREGRGEHGAGGREGRGEHGGRGREGRGEGRGEAEGGEEGGKRLGKTETWNATRNGAHLILAYDPASRSFKGTVVNKTAKILSQVRVEVHLSNGVELGPTKRTDLKPGAKISVELSAAGQEFTWWTTHPEHGSEEGHGPGHEGEKGEGGGEHGEGRGNRPKDSALRPLYNQLQLLRQEIKSLARTLETKKR